jgi:hypothetical protein
MNQTGYKNPVQVDPSELLTLSDVYGDQCFVSEANWNDHRHHPVQVPLRDKSGTRLSFVEAEAIGQTIHRENVASVANPGEPVDYTDWTLVEGQCGYLEYREKPISRKWKCSSERRPCIVREIAQPHARALALQLGWAMYRYVPGRV